MKLPSYTGPVGLALWTLVVGGLLIALPTGQARVLVVLAVFIIYLVVAMVSLVRYPGWWLRAFVTLLAGPVVMTALIAIAEAFQERSVGEGALALLGPLMISWGVIPVTGLIKLAMAKWSAPTPR